MMIHKKPWCKYNVFIFNNIENNEEDIKLLTKTFKNLNCSIITYQSLSLDDYETAIQKICKANFGVYDYIVVIVLDNKNRYQHILAECGDQNLRINNDLLVRILQNKTLADKKRLFIIQTNQVYSDDAPGPSKVYYEEPLQFDDKGNKKVMKTYAGKTIHIYATGPNCKLEDHWSEGNAKPSPFIDSFCRNLSKYGENKTIQYVYDRICKDLENHEFIPYMDLLPEVKFGKALTANEIEDFFPERHLTSTSSDDSTDCHVADGERLK